jgi:hypothetical protein
LKQLVIPAKAGIALQELKADYPATSSFSCCVEIKAAGLTNRSTVEERFPPSRE